MPSRGWSWTARTAIAVVFCAVGCGEANTPAPATADATVADTVAAIDSTASGDSGNACPIAATVVGSTPIAINEVQGKGDDWIELLNTGDQSVSLGGMHLADMGANGCPKMDEALLFPTSASLPPGGRLLVVGKKAPKAGEQTDCLPGASGTCWHMAFKVSATSGDAIFLISGGKVVAAAAVPPNALTDTASWGRLPDGTGTYTNVVPTPGTANKK